MNFRDYQREALRRDRVREEGLKGLMVPLLGLAGETGSLLTEYKKWLREGESYRPFTDQVSEEIGDILWYLSNLASKLNLDLGEVAAENLAKIEQRWPPAQPPHSVLFTNSAGRYDQTFPPNEQLPTELRVDFIEERGPAGTRLTLRSNGQQVGDSLTDNSYADDGYRFHDVFHLSNAILLGWSPVTRALLRRKRKTVPRIDEVEDGARAAVTEEAISAVVFSHARDYSFFSTSTSVDYELLRTIRGMTRPFEVRDKSLADWERTILAAYRVWRGIRDHGGGTFVGNGTVQTVSFEMPKW